jgi:predicted tellurium resistance membrane protein TerC
VNLVSAAVLVPLLAVVTPENRRARVIAFGVLGALVLVLLIAFAAWAV